MPMNPMGGPMPSPMPMPPVGPMPMPMAVPPPAGDAARQKAAENVRYLMLAMHNYMSSYNKFPPAWTEDAGGRKLFSWRVLMLPYIEQSSLWDKLKRDEPWDSAHNRPILESAPMPLIYESPGVTLPKSHTAMLAILAPNGLILTGDKKHAFGTPNDGTANTIAIFEAPAAKAVPWYEPGDFVPNPGDPTSGMFGARPGGMLAALADGRVIAVPETTDKAQVSALLTFTGGEKVEETFLNGLVVPFRR
jgi:hypothetical protein